MEVKTYPWFSSLFGAGHALWIQREKLAWVPTALMLHTQNDFTYFQVHLPSFPGNTPKKKRATVQTEYNVNPQVAQFSNSVCYYIRIQLSYSKETTVTNTYEIKSFEKIKVYSNQLTVKCPHDKNLYWLASPIVFNT